MKKTVVVLVVLLALAIPIAPACAAVPTCVLGGPTAMDTNRQLAEGETFVLTNRPLVVNLRFRPTTDHPEQVGECMLPSNSEVAEKNGILLWVRECGNDEVNRNILVAPLPTPPASVLHGMPTVNYTLNSVTINNTVTERPPIEQPKVGNWYTRWWHEQPVVATIVHVAVGGVLYTAFNHGKNNNNPPRGKGDTI